MRTGVVALIALYLSLGAATAQTDQKEMWAFGEVAGEMQVCGAYFGVISRCIKPQRPDLAATYQQMSDRIMLTCYYRSARGRRIGSSHPRTRRLLR